MKNWGKKRAERGNEGVLFRMEWRARQKETGCHRTPQAAQKKAGREEHSGGTHPRERGMKRHTCEMAACSQMRAG